MSKLDDVVSRIERMQRSRGYSTEECGLVVTSDLGGYDDFKRARERSKRERKLAKDVEDLKVQVAELRRVVEERSK